MKLGQLMCLASLNLVAIARPRLRDLFEDIAFRSPRSESELVARYRQMIVVRFNLTTVDDAAAIEKAIERFSKDVWAYGRDFVDIGMNGKDLTSFLSVLPPTLGSAYTTLIHDVASLVHNTYPATYRNGNNPPTFQEVLQKVPQKVLQKVLDKESGRTRALLSEDDSIFFSDYQPLSVIIRWMRFLEGLFPSLVRVTSIGTSYEGREIPALKVSVKKASPESPRKTLVVTGGLHAREWISTTTVNYVAWSYITQYGKDRMVTKFLDEFDLVFIPVVNPDGVQYTWQVDRLWRKSRQETKLRFCRGMDLDRAFGYEWDGRGAGGDPCSETYGGSEPFQAVEAQQVAVWAKAESENGVVFEGLVDLHSYSQQILFPYSYSCSVDPPNLENLEELGVGLAKAIRLSSGEIYSVTSACEGITTHHSNGLRQAERQPRVESSGGSAMDWFYHELHARYSYQIKLRDTGGYGFLLPAEYIVPTGKEIFSAFKYLGDYLLGNNGIEGTANSDMDTMAGPIPGTDELR